MGTCGTDEAQHLIELPDSCRSPPPGSGRVRPPAVATVAAQRVWESHTLHESAARSTSVPNAFPQDQRVKPNLLSLRILSYPGNGAGDGAYSSERGHRFQAIVVMSAAGPAERDDLFTMRAMSRGMPACSGTISDQSP